MAIWILLAIAAQFLNAIVSLVDKYIVTSKHVLPQPFVYAFYTCVLSGGAIVVYAFGWISIPLEGVSFPSLRNVHFPSLEVMGLSMLAASTFFYALMSMFKALQQSDASDVVPVVGAVSAIASFGLAYVFLDTRLSPNFLLGIILLATGTALVSHFRFSRGGALPSVYAGLFFALHYVLIKGLFNSTSFDEGFFWSRVGFVVFAIGLLAVPRYRSKILAQAQSTGKRASKLVLGNKVIAGFASILILKATELGDVSVVQALGGLHYIFIFVLSITTVGPYAPSACGEKGCTPNVLLHKALFVGMITLGFFVLFR